MPDIINNDRKIAKSNTSGYTGVSYETHAHKYRAYVHYCGEKIPLGYFMTATEAARVRAEAQQFYKTPLVDRLRLVGFIQDKFGLSPDEALSGVIAALSAFHWGDKINISTFTIDFVRRRVSSGERFPEVAHPEYPDSELLCQWLNGMSMARIARNSGNQTSYQIKARLIAERRRFLNEVLRSGQ